jgi:hypothetical protein
VDFSSYPDRSGYKSSIIHTALDGKSFLVVFLKIIQNLWAVAEGKVDQTALDAAR